ncbi:MAG: ribonuclease III [Lachnospiraceae bacterium]|nr:ribonuclease III [Roseburia sp.]MEE0375974.1 ribonuclease III [Lachnospiraceae bacterium]OLA62657.1 MAG: ribonuclease III [Roseburia sp. CAG:10041_57]HCI18058.1 ribonuclease III [Lachnospiraceae bacterium]
MNELLEELQDKIGYRFQNTELLKQALTHSSFANEQKINKLKDYERLEFLGDAVLELVSSEFLFRENPQMPEGQLTKLRASMVCEPALAYCAKDIDLGSYILLGRGEEYTGGRYRSSITSDVMEAIIGAIFLDGGIENAKKHIYRFILSDLENKILFLDSKTILQEEIQKKKDAQLRYELIGESGPDHNKQFTVDAYLNDVLIGSGTGRTKKAAEQQAAYEALLKMKGKHRK